MNKQNMTPVQLRLILSIILLLLVGLGAGMFMVGSDKLKKHSLSAQEIATKSEASRSSLQNLIVIKKTLAEKSDIVDRANQLVAESQRYQYQDQIITDINQFAANAGLTITNISFDDTKVVATTPAATPASDGTAPTAPSGIKSMAATITIKNPVSYSSMLNFIHSIEQSLFRMQISKVSLSQASGEEVKNGVSSDAFTIEVYVR